MGHNSPQEAPTLAAHGPKDQALTLINRFDPRYRVVASFAYAILIVSLFSFSALLFALLFSVVVMLSARLPFKETLKKIAMMDSFIIFLICMLPFTTEGDVVFHLFGLSLTQQGFEKAALIALKTNAIVMMLLALVGTVEPQKLGAALRHLHVPQNLVHLILFSVRYIDVLKQEYRRLRNGMKTRCFQPRNNLHTYRSIGYLVGMLVIRSLERSERILQAMKCRGFCGKFYIMDTFKSDTVDYIGTSVFIMICAIIILLEIGYVTPY